MNGYFVTGTGTGVGKTHVTAALARSFRGAGKQVFAFKPIETGCENVNGTLVGADQTILCHAAGDWQAGELRGVYRFEPPVAPFVASPEIDFGRIHRAFVSGARQADVVLVEGAGGWRVPVTPYEDMGALAKLLGLPIIVVANATLGTINHSLLTVEAIERDGCVVVGLVLSKLPTDDLAAAQSNVEQIAKRWSGRIVLYTNDSSQLATFHVETT